MNEKLLSTTLGNQIIRCPDGATLSKQYGYAVIDRGRYALHIFREYNSCGTWYAITNHERWIARIWVRD